MTQLIKLHVPGSMLYLHNIFLPGVSDDAISCALMLEVLQVLSQEATTLPHSIIFLFNGAEENVLQVCHFCASFFI